MHVLLFFCYIACCIQSESPWTFEKTFQHGGQACIQAFPGIRNHWRKVRLTYCFCFLIVCVFILSFHPFIHLIFSEAFSADCWWRARRISSIINHLKEVGPTFFFAINIFVLTLCFTCLFRSLFCALRWKSEQAVFSIRKHLRKVRICMYCFA